MYLNLEYIQNQIPPEVLNLITEDVSNNFDMNVINEIFFDVESEIDLYILASSYNIETVKQVNPPVLRRIALKIFKYYAVSRKSLDRSIIETLGIDYENAKNMLEKIKDGELPLDGVPIPSESSSDMDSVYDNASFNNQIFKIGFDS